MTRYMLFLSFFTSLHVFSSTMEDEPTTAQKAAVENAIRICETRYLLVARGRYLYPNMKKPGMLSSRWLKTNYADRHVSEKAFNILLGEFAIFTTREKIRLRTALAGSLPELVMSYSSNCLRFAEGLAKFVESTTTNKRPSLTERNYIETWKNMAKGRKETGTQEQRLFSH